MKYILLLLTFMFATVSTQAKDTITSQVHVTVYQPVAAQCQGNPLQTADGSIINLKKLEKGEIKWCALSRDLLKKYPMGSKIHIEGFGIYEVKDTMAAKHIKCVDLLIHPKDETRISKSGVKIRLIALPK